MTLHEMMGQFRPPFPVSVMEWKVQATNSAKSKALAAPYADTRAYEDRLNEVVPDDWASRAEFLQAGERLICTVHLTVLGVTRAGDGESPLKDANAATVAYAQAFKRACSRFGLGRYLYDLNTGWQEIEQRGKSSVFTDAAMNRLRQSYKQYCQGKVALEGNGHEPQTQQSAPHSDEPPDLWDEEEQDGGALSFVADTVKVLMTQKNTPYLMFTAGADAASWFKGRDELLKAAPWIGTVYTKDDFQPGSALPLSIRVEYEVSGQYRNAVAFAKA